MEEVYKGYRIIAVPVKTPAGRWSVAVAIKSGTAADAVEKKYIAEDGISYILKEEAAKECLNLGRNLIRTGHAGF